VDLVLGVSMAPTTIRMVLVEGENADGVTVEEEKFDFATADAPTLSESDQVISAILGTREGAAEAGYQLLSTGVTWTNPDEGAALRDALAGRKVENVMLVSAFLAAAALAQTVGQAIGYEHTAMLFVEPESATLGIVNCDDGSVTDVRKEPLDCAGADAVAQLTEMVSGVEALQSRPEGVFVVGCGVDIAPIKRALEAATPLAVNAPEDPETALARGAALASANAPLFASSTAALAYAQDPGTGEIDPGAVAPDYLDDLDVPGVEQGAEGLAYSAVPDEEADAETTVIDTAEGLGDPQRRRQLLLASSALAAIFLAVVVALEISLAISIRPTVALRPNPGQSLIVPSEQAPAPPPKVQVPAPQPQSIHVPAGSAPAAPANGVAPAVPAPAAPPIPAAVPVPAAPLPVPVPAHVPAPAPVHVPAPQPPVNLPVPQPPVQVPNPQLPVHAPTPPVQQPVPPVHAPTPPVEEPVPEPPVHIPAPEPPVNLPAPEPPMNMPAPEPPIHMPAPEAPPAPAMPAPEAPHIPVMPAPAAPPVPAMPHIPIIIPHIGF
jgi:hypothetical protein